MLHIVNAKYGIHGIGILMITAFDYLKFERKLTDETIRKFHLAWCDSTGEIYIDADYQGQLPKLDKRFYHSTMFPIQSVYGDTVAVSCRPLGPSPTKYINTNYEKADHLYGLFQNYKEILKAQKVYVAEGNLSMITPWQCGLKNVVALLGINISYTQLCLLNRFAKQVCFMVDADKAGDNFIEKMRQQIPSRFYDTDMKFSFVQLPPKQDPDSYFQTHSLEEFLDIPEQELIV
jgi:DNA primase